MNDQGGSDRIARPGTIESVAEAIDRAFHYRGDVTVRTDDGGSVTGYLFNRNARTSEPFAQLFETRTGREVSIPYRSITQVQFTGRDATTASVKHFAAFQNRQEGPRPPHTPVERHGD